MDALYQGKRTNTADFEQRLFDRLHGNEDQDLTSNVDMFLGDNKLYEELFKQDYNPVVDNITAADATDVWKLCLKPTFHRSYNRTYAILDLINKSVLERIFFQKLDFVEWSGTSIFR